MDFITDDQMIYPPLPDIKYFLEKQSDDVYTYGQWIISSASWVLPVAEADWDWYHQDYDGPGDNRCGTAKDFLSCIDCINELEDD